MTVRLLEGVRGRLGDEGHADAGLAVPELVEGVSSSNLYSLFIIFPTRSPSLPRGTFRLPFSVLQFLTLCSMLFALCPYFHYTLTFNYLS